MFIRKTIKVDRDSRKNYHQFQLVESIRTDRGPRQHILLNLGTDLDLSDQERKQLANYIENKVKGIQTLFPYPPLIEELGNRFAKQLVQQNNIKSLIEPSKINKEKTENDFYTININTVEHEYVRTVGLEHICLETIRKLELDKQLLELGFSKRQIEVAIGIIIARLAGCCSDKSSFEWLRDISGLGELLEIGFERLSANSVYSIADRLIEKKSQIENFLYNKEKQIFSLDNTVVFYDLTNTYFEGGAKSISKAAKGRSKDKRADCPLVTLGLRLDQAGFPIKSEVLPGNISEPKTLQLAISQLDIGDSKKPTIVFDAGLVTEENISWLRAEGYSYIVCSRRRDQTPPTDLSFEIVREKNGNIVKAGNVYDPNTDETLVYCHSKFKESKEIEWMQSTRKRFEEALVKLNNGLNKKGHTKGLAAVHTKIGGLKKRYSKIAQFYKIDVSTNSSEKIVTAISWSFNEENASKRLAGNYCLRTFGIEANTKKLWNIYIMLTKVEEAFRCLKSELGMRPIHHQIERRLDAHLFIAVLAYHVLHTIQMQLTQKGIHLRWKTIQQRMQSHARVTTKMMTKNNKMLHVRTASNPEPFHKTIYNALSLKQKPGSKITTLL